MASLSRVRIGDLRHRIELQEIKRIADGAGGNSTHWETYAVEWGKIEPLEGTERLEAQRLQAQLTHLLTIRYRVGVSTAHRVLFKGRPMQIRAVVNVEERGQWLRLSLEEGVAS